MIKNYQLLNNAITQAQLAYATKANINKVKKSK